MGRECRVVRGEDWKVARFRKGTRGGIERLFWDYVTAMGMSPSQAFRTGLVIYVSTDIGMCWGIYRQQRLVGFFATFRCQYELVPMLQARDLDLIVENQHLLRYGPVLYFAEVFVAEPRLAYRVFRSFTRTVRAEKICRIVDGRWHERKSSWQLRREAQWAKAQVAAA